MAAGNFTLTGLNITLVSTDNSCKAVMQSIDAYYWSTNVSSRKTLGCSSDPVVVNSKIYSAISSSNAATQNIATMSATPFKKMDWFDTAHLMQALLVVAVVLMFVRGFDSGNKL